MFSGYTGIDNGDFPIENGDCPIEHGDVPPKKRDELPGTGDIWGFPWWWEGNFIRIPSLCSWGTSQFCHVLSGCYIAMV